jgi:hemerythrin superfamily protein
MTITEPNPATKLLRDQHADIRAHIATISGAVSTERAEPFNELAQILDVHEAAEETIVYPIVREISDDAAAEVDQRIAEETEAKGVLADLKAMDPSTEEFKRAFDAFKLDVDAHANAEEATIFQIIESSVPSGKLDEMAAKLQAAIG